MSGSRFNNIPERALKTIMRLVQIFAILLIVFTTDGLPALALTASAQTATPGPATPVADTAGQTPAQASTTATAAEQELADRYVPITRLRTQPDECSNTGERYVPIAVDITLNNPEVKLPRPTNPRRTHITKPRLVGESHLRHVLPRRLAQSEVPVEEGAEPGQDALLLSAVPAIRREAGDRRQDPA